MSDELDDLLAQAEEASLLSRIEYRDPIARHREAAIGKISLWVSDSRLGAFAVRVIEATVKFGVPASVVKAKLEELEDNAATPQIADDIDSALQRLGARSRRRVNPPPGTPRVTRRPPGERRSMRSWTHWHLVEGSVMAGDGRRCYLSACHRWNSEGFINRKGLGLRSAVPDDERLCLHCNEAEYTGYRTGGQTAWTIAHAQTTDLAGRQLLWCGETRHIAVSGGPLTSDECGPAHMTECGWWIERDRVTTARSGSSAVVTEPVCEACLRFVHALQSQEASV